jgi:DNA transformation protein
VNIGTEVERQLLDAGITTPEDLQRVGSRRAWLELKQRDPSACYSRLCALEGAIQGIRWHHLSAETKQDLKRFYQEH